MRYLNKHKYNIESLIENNKKIIEKLITNDNDIMFIECFEQVMLCLPTVYKMQNRIDECKEILRKFAKDFIEFLENIDETTDDEFNDLHMLFGATCALAELQAALPGEITSPKPLRLVLDRRPFI